MTHDDNWQWGGSMLAGFTDPDILSETYYSQPLEPTNVPVYIEFVEKLHAQGYRPKKVNASMGKQSTKRRHPTADDPAGTLTQDTYSVTITLYAHATGEGGLKYHLYGQGASPDAAIEAVTARENHDGLYYLGEPLPMGKGQIKRAKAIALTMIEENRTHLNDKGYVYVDVLTRAGRYGLKGIKVTERCFNIGELLNPTEKTTFPKIICPVQILRFSEKWYDHGKKQVGYKQGNYAVGRFATFVVQSIDEDYVVLKDEKYSDCYRLSRHDWDRLQAKIQHTP
jgi:hypothetical protein